MYSNEEEGRVEEGGGRYSQAVGRKTDSVSVSHSSTLIIKFHINITTNESRYTEYWHMWNKLILTTLLSWMIKKKNNNKQSSVPGFALFFLVSCCRCVPSDFSPHWQKHWISCESFTIKKTPCSCTSRLFTVAAAVGDNSSNFLQLWHSVGTVRENYH